MPENRPTRPVRFNAAPRNKSPRRPRKPRGDDKSTALYWIGALLVIIAAAVIAAWVEGPDIKAWFAGTIPSSPSAAAKYPLESLPQGNPTPAPAPKPPVVATPKLPPPAPVVPPQPPALTPEQQRHLKLEQEAARETRKLEERTQISATNTAAAIPPKPTAPGEPPIAQPVPLSAAHGAPARALPLDSNILTTERIAAYQVALERIHFSCGFVDGDQGMRTQRMLRAYQKEHGLPITGLVRSRHARGYRRAGRTVPHLHRDRSRRCLDHAQAADVARQGQGDAARL